MDLCVQSLVLQDHHESAPQNGEEDEQHHREPWNSVKKRVPLKALKKHMIFRWETNGVTNQRPRKFPILGLTGIYHDLPKVNLCSLTHFW